MELPEDFKPLQAGLGKTENEIAPKSPEVETVNDQEQLEQCAAYAESQIDQQTADFFVEGEKIIESSIQSMNISSEMLATTRQEQGLDSHLQEVRVEADSLASETKLDIKTVIQEIPQEASLSVESTDPAKEIKPENEKSEKEKPEFLYHGTDLPNIEEFEPRKRLIPGGDKGDVSARVYAGDNPAFAAAFSFPWSTDDGFELSVDDAGKVIFNVPIKFKDRLNQLVYLYKMSSDQFKPTSGEGTGHSYHTENKVKPIEVQTFKSVQAAIENFGGVVKFYKEKQKPPVVAEQAQTAKIDADAHPEEEIIKPENKKSETEIF